MRRPKAQDRNEALRQAIEAELEASGGMQSKLRAIARVLIDRASRGDIAAIHELAERLDGPVRKSLFGKGLGSQNRV